MRQSRHAFVQIVRIVLFAVCLAGAPATAQHNGPVAESAQARPELFQRAVTALNERVVSINALEQLRAQLAEVRQLNNAIVQRGSVEADTLRAQLAALGPPPDDGQKEAEEIALRRLELNGQLAQADAPIRAAREKLRQAEVLIRLVDRQLRAREWESMSQRYPSPLKPSTWEAGLADIRQYFNRLNRDIASELARPSVSKRLDQTIPMAIGLGVLGFLFLAVFQRWVSRRLIALAERQQSGPKALLFAIVCNLNFLVLPAVGAAALVAIVPLIGIQPNSARTVIVATPVMALIMVLAHWLGHTIFSPGQQGWRLLNLGEREARLGLRLCQALGVFLVLEVIVEALERDYDFQPAATSVASTPLIAFAAILLWLLAGVLRNDRGRHDGATQPKLPDGEQEAEDGESDAAVTRRDSGFLLFLSLLMKASAVLAVVVALAGYVQLSRIATLPMIVTVALLGVGFLLYHVALLIFKAATETTDEDREPVFFSIGLICLLTVVFLPLIALSWGARPTDLVEFWRLVRDGIQLGDIRLSLNTVLVLAAVFGIGVAVTRWLQNLLKASVLPQTRMDTGAQTAIVTGTGYIGLTLAALIAVSTAGLNLASLAVVAGALSVGIGFGLQTIVSNFVSGIILLIERPIKEGDWIEVSGQSGYVRKISVRSTRIETFDRHDVIIPNSDLIAGTVKNMTLSSKTGRLILPVGIAYGSDLEQVKSILLAAARGHYTVARYPAPFVLFKGLGDSSLDFELRCYLKNVENILTTQSDLYFTVYNELGKAGVEIPFPQRDLHLKDVDRLVAAIERRALTEKPHESAVETPPGPEKGSS
ncbi:mechanosensitive ion channel family protein [Roseibium aggregatum]|uniref:Mechanosensitive ion channel family protein n=1 Tax=Roseibium aggregatum TaxID=187304 RepID=A0A939J2E9_9HYPH|nr:DUF3772 domain-containing protein [Roseibium aggregatum]MBN9671353.1 mechanosensitive ion channel family protein [Roseibium aggregatum]